MPVDLATSLPLLLPRAVAWAEAQADAVLAGGIALESPGLRLARDVGVRNPESIRIGVVDRLPLPDDASLREAALQAGLLGPGVIGLTLGYSVLICRGYEANVRLLRLSLVRSSVWRPMGPCEPGISERGACAVSQPDGLRLRRDSAYCS